MILWPLATLRLRTNGGLGRLLIVGVIFEANLVEILIICYPHGAAFDG